MILRVSAAFAERFKCDLSHEGVKVPQERRLDAWSYHYVRIGRKPLVVVMNDASLYTFVIPATGVKGFTDFWRRLLGQITELWWRHGAEFDADNQTVILLRRTDRSLIGSMNDAVKLIRFHDELARKSGEELDLMEMERRSNATPYSSLGFNNPGRLMKQMLGEGEM
jgi:hypothetical protein